MLAHGVRSMLDSKVLSALFMASNALSSLLLLNVCYNRAKARVA